eukprot:PITA_27126
MDAGNSSSQIVYFSGYEMEDQEAGIREMDAENDSGQLMNSSGHEMEDQEAERMKEGSQLHRKVKHYRKGCKDFVQPTLLRKVPAYIIAQLGGSITASFALRVMFNPVTNTGVTIPSQTVLQALAMEIVVSFVLMFVTSAVATDSSAIGELAGIAVGSMVMISSIFAGPISGGSMNPARSLGPAIVSNNYKAIWVYLLGPIGGTLMGACSYSIIRLTDKPLQAISLRRASLFSKSGRSQNM